jgi:hypothetical protein
MVDALVPTDADLELLQKLIIQHREETGRTSPRLAI